MTSLPGQGSVMRPVYRLSILTLGEYVLTLNATAAYLQHHAPKVHLFVSSPCVFVTVVFSEQTMQPAIPRRIDMPYIGRKLHFQHFRILSWHRTIADAAEYVPFVVTVKYIYRE